jgi:hypothetical protein
MVTPSVVETSWSPGAAPQRETNPQGRRKHGGAARTTLARTDAGEAVTVLGQVAAAVIGTAVVLLCVAALAWGSYEKRWSADSRRRRAALRRPTVADLLAKYRDVDDD